MSKKKIVSPHEAANPQITIEQAIQSLAYEVKRIMMVCQGLDDIQARVMAHLQLNPKDMVMNYDVIQHDDGRLDLLAKPKPPKKKKDAKSKTPKD